MTRLVVVLPLVPLTEGDAFAVREWPLHITVVPRFRTDATGAQIADAIRSAVRGHPAIDLVAAHDELFGRGHDIPVTVMADSEPLTALHHTLRGAVRPFAPAPDEPAFTGERFRPHVTAKVHGRIHEGDWFTLTQVARPESIRASSLSEDQLRVPDAWVEYTPVAHPPAEQRVLTPDRRRATTSYVVSGAGTHASAGPALSDSTALATSPWRSSRIAVIGVFSLRCGFPPMNHWRATRSPSAAASSVHWRWANVSRRAASERGSGPSAFAHRMGSLRSVRPRQRCHERRAEGCVQFADARGCSSERLRLLDELAAAHAAVEIGIDVFDRLAIGLHPLKGGA